VLHRDISANTVSQRPIPANTRRYPSQAPAGSNRTFRRTTFTCANGVWEGTLTCPFDPNDPDEYRSEDQADEGRSTRYARSPILAQSCLPLPFHTLRFFSSTH
jgi:hypothetical protein